jgi:histone deacetylase 1/2
MELRGENNVSANLATKGGRSGNNGSFGRGRGNGSRGGFGRGFKRGGRGGNGRGRGSFAPGVICQLCGKEGHTVIKCFKRFDTSFTGAPQKSASSATTSYGVDTNWYVDSGATDHVTSELEKLTIRDKYGGHDQVHSASGAGMEIIHIGSSTLHTPTSKFISTKFSMFLEPPKIYYLFIVLHEITMPS